MKITQVQSKEYTKSTSVANFKLCGRKSDLSAYQA